MSFILDALKKSENERRRNIGPSLADVRVVRRTGERPWWAFAVAGLLVINLGVLIAVLLNRNTTSASTERAPAAASATRDQAAQPPQAQTQAAATRTSRAPTADAPSPSVRSLADEAAAYGSLDPQLGPDLAAASAVPDGPPLVRPIESAAAAPASQAVFDARSAEFAETLPTHGDLTAGGTALPDLHLDIHVHAANPGDRFVFINMRKYVEGQTLTEGPALERITPDGVVLNQRGLRFLLPRQ